MFDLGLTYFAAWKQFGYEYHVDVSWHYSAMQAGSAHRLLSLTINQNPVLVSYFHRLHLAKQSTMLGVGLLLLKE